MISFKEHCEGLGLVPHEFDGPYLKGHCIVCGLLLGEHPPTAGITVLQTVQEESQVQQPPVPRNELSAIPSYRIVAQLPGMEPLTTSWLNLDAATDAYKTVAGKTSLEVSVFLRVGETEIDLLAIVDKFREAIHLCAKCSV